MYERNNDQSVSTVPGSSIMSNAEEIEAQARRVNRQFPTGVVVVTTLYKDEPVGLAVNAFTSVSREPPMILVCVNESSKSFPRIFDGEHIGINILASDQADVANFFAQSGGDKFAKIDWHHGATGVPVLDATAGFFELEIKYKIPAYTHTIFLGQVVEVSSNNEKAPLIYHGGEFYDGESVLCAAGSPRNEAHSSDDAEAHHRAMLEFILSQETRAASSVLHE